MPVVIAACLRYVRHMVGRDGLYQVSSRLHVSKFDRSGLFGVSDIRTVSGLGSVPTPYKLWPEFYRTITPTLYYILIAAWVMLISIHVEGRHICASGQKSPAELTLRIVLLGVPHQFHPRPNCQDLVLVHLVQAMDVGLCYRSRHAFSGRHPFLRRPSASGDSECI